MAVSWTTIDRLELRYIRTARPGSLGKIGVSKHTVLRIEETGLANPAKLPMILRALGLTSTDVAPAFFDSGRFQRQRKRNGLTISELARKCAVPTKVGERGYDLPFEIDAALLRQIERGRAKNAQTAAGSREMCRRFMTAFNCSWSDLVVDSGQETIDYLLNDLTSLWIKRLLRWQDAASGGLKVAFGPDERYTQPWSTAQGLVGILQVSDNVSKYKNQVRRALAYFDNCRQPLGSNALDAPLDQPQGWALFEDESIPITELTCWVNVARALALRAALIPRSPLALQLAAEIPVLLRHQFNHPDGQSGGFCPTAQLTMNNQRTYSTIMAIWALIEIVSTIRHELTQEVFDSVGTAIERAIAWLIETWDMKWGWVPRPYGGRRIHHPGLTAQTLFTLLLTEQGHFKVALLPRYHLAVEGFLAHSEQFFGIWDFDSPEANMGINARDVKIDDTEYRLEGSDFFWVPWSLAFLGLHIRKLQSGDAVAHARCSRLRDRAAEAAKKALTDPKRFYGTPQIGESLYGIAFLRPEIVSHESRIERIYAVHPLNAATILDRVRRQNSVRVGYPISEPDLATDPTTQITDQNHPGGSAAVRKLAVAANINEDTLVLDVGCGLGGSARILASEFQASVQAVELTSSRFRDAVHLTHLTGLSSKVEIHQGDFLNIKLPERNFDVIWGQAAWVHFRDLEPVFARCARLLRPGGRIALEEAYLRSNPTVSLIRQRVAELEEYWVASLKIKSHWTAVARKYGFRVSMFENLTSVLLSDLESLLVAQLRKPAVPISPGEQRGRELGIQLVRDGILGYFRMIAQLA